MSTDEDLTRELGAAFREATATLRYTGRVPAPRRTPLVVVPVAVGAAAAVAVAAGGLGGSAGHRSASVPQPGAASATPGTHARLVTDTVSFAGYTFSYERRADQRDPFVVRLAPRGVPAGATRVPLDGPAKAWVGTDPRSGDAALFVQAPTRNDGHLFEMSSSMFTREQLVRLLRTGRPSR